MGSSLGFKDKTILLFLLLAVASIMSVVVSSAAGTPRKLMEKDHPVRFEMETSEVAHKGEDIAAAFHPRILKVTNDYGNYDPSPELEKPPFKLIPN